MPNNTEYNQAYRYPNVTPYILALRPFKGFGGGKHKVRWKVILEGGLCSSAVVSAVKSAGQ